MKILLITFEKSKALFYFLFIAIVSPYYSFAKNPWMGDNTIDPGDLQQTVTEDTISMLKVTCIISGVFLLAYCARTLWVTISRDADERKEHGNAVMSILISALGAMVGMILLGLAWSGLDTDIN